jgi:hypothetical protein
VPTHRSGDAAYFGFIAQPAPALIGLVVAMVVASLAPFAQASTLWSPSSVPATTSMDSSTAYELGVKFESSVSGYITGVRFYKGTGNTGTHIGHLWTAGGTLLAAATFTNESSSGWQTVNFSSPVAITANTVYVASYWEPNGHYSVSRDYFASAYSNAPLEALASSTDGGNGVFNTGSSAFPTETYEETNYWVDVVFVPTTGSSLWNTSVDPPTTTDSTAYELGVKFESSVSGYITGVRFYKPSGSTGTNIGHLWTAGGTLLATATFTNESSSGWQTVSFSSPVAITANTVYVASYWEPDGSYARSRPYFTSAYSNPPLEAPASGTDGGNGVFNTVSSTFPTETYEEGNYWVDVLFAVSSSDAGDATTQLLSGSPSSLSFGDVNVGTSSTLPVVITNTGTGSVTISTASASGTGFSVSAPTLPLTVASGQDTSFSVTFKPTAAGSATGELSVTSNASNSPTVTSLSGTGISTPASVSLSWTASTSTGVVGYYVYRGTASGGPYTQLNSSPVDATTYTDTTVEAGETYYYVTTAVTSQGTQSAYSNQAKAVVPSS